MRFVLTLLLGLFAATSQAAGLKFAEIPASTDGPALKVAIWTPCAISAQQMTLGPYVLDATPNCPTVGQNLPLVLISHGHAGSLLNHHDLAEVLADSGYVVAAINHPGDNHSDLSRTADMSVFVERPTDIKRLIDYMLGAAPDAQRIDANRIGFFGFSRGGYTGLVLAGATPDPVHANVPCPDQQLPICRQLRRKQAPRGPWTHDPRIKAFVLADPLDEFPTAKSLKDVKAPIQLWASQFGGDGVLPETMPALAPALPNEPDYHLVAQAGHFAFLPPCSPQLAKAAPQICVDAKPFDRGTFHRALDEKVLQFFETHLK